jgi:hypothetical protein
MVSEERRKTKGRREGRKLRGSGAVWRKKEGEMERWGSGHALNRGAVRNREEREKEEKEGKRRREGRDSVKREKGEEKEKR